MKDWEYNVALVLSVLSIVLAAWIVIAGRQNEKLQAKLQGQQTEIEAGAACQQMGVNLVRDMVALAPRNEVLRGILAKYGVDVPVAKTAGGQDNDKNVVKKQEVGKSVGPDGKQVRMKTSKKSGEK